MFAFIRDMINLANAILRPFFMIVAIVSRAECTWLRGKLWAVSVFVGSRRAHAFANETFNFHRGGSLFSTVQCRVL